MALKVGELYASFGIDSSGIGSTLSGIEKQCNEIASDFTKTGAVLSASVTAPIVAFGKEVYQVGSEFQAQMSRVQSISEATDEQLADLTQTAKDLGASSSFSASQAAEGMEFLASAGFKVEEIIAAMPGMLDLAASSGEDLATSADIAASVLRGFGMEAEDAAHVADVLAKNAAATNAAVYDTGEAMKYVAPLANTMGLSFEEVAASIGLMSNAGIKGSQAGTTLRGALSRLAKPTEVMQVTMDELGLSFYDSEGKMKSLTEMITMLQTNMSGLTEEQQQNALVTLFGQEALSGMMVLLEAGPQALAELTEAYEECDGAAEDMAATMLNNLKGAVEAFGGAVETAQINLYDRFEPAMTSTVQTATELVNSFNLLDDATKDVVYKVAGLAAATGPALIGLGGVVSAVGKLVPLMISLASPIGVVTAGLALFAVAAVDAENDIGKTFVKVSKDIKKSLSSINKQIESSMKKVSKRIPALAQSVSEGLGEIIPEAANTALLVVKGFIDTISSNASDLAGVGLTIIASISDGISRNLPQLIPSAAQMVANIGMALIRNAPKLLQSVATLAKSIWDGIANTDWLGLGEEILSALGDSLEEIVTMFSRWFTDAKEAAENIDWSSVCETIKGSFDISSDWLKNLILGDAATETTWADIGQSILDAIQNKLNNIGPWVRDRFEEGKVLAASIDWSEVWSKIQTTSASLKEKAFEVASNLISWIGEKLSSFDGSSISDVLGNVESIASAITDSIINSKIDFVEKGNVLISQLVNGMSRFDLSMLASPFASIATAIIDGVASAIPSVAGAATSIIDSIGNLLLGVDWVGMSVSFDGFATAIINSICKGMEAAYGAEVLIINAISDLLSDVDWSSLGDAAENIGGIFIDGIVAGLSTMTSGASSVLDAISGTIQRIDWSELGSTAASLAESLLNGLMSGLANLTPDIGELLGAIGRGIAAAGEGLGDAARSIVAHLVTAIVTPETWTTLVTLGAEIVGGIASGIIELGAGILEGAWSVVKGTLKGLFEGLGFEFTEWSAETEAALSASVAIIDSTGEEINTSLHDIVDYINNFDNGLVQIDSSTLTTAIDGWNTIITNGTEELVGSMQEYAYLGCAEITKLFEILTSETSTAVDAAAAMIALKDLGFGELVSNSFAASDLEIQAAAQRMSESGVATFEDAFKVLGITIPEAVQAGLDAGLPLVEASAAAVATVASTANDQAQAEASATATGDAIIAKLSESETAGEPVVEEASQGVVDVATVAFESLPDIAEVIGSDSAAAMATGIDNGAPDVETSMDALAADVVEAALLQMSYETGYATGYDYTTAMMDGITAVAAAIQSACNAVATNVKNTCFNVLSYSNGSSIGRQFDNGIAAGIRSGSSAITSAARSAAYAALSAAKSALGIHSPSTVAEKEVGWMYDEGIAEGVLGRMSTIRKAASEVMEFMHDMFLVDDPARGTVYSSRQAISQTAKKTAEAAADSDSAQERAEAMGRAIADRLIESGALDSDVYMDKDKVGEKVSGSVSKTIKKKTQKTVKGRSLQGVLA